jgi:NADPH:quinone reductase-like Zn-dependent oxidoreductase
VVFDNVVRHIEQGRVRPFVARTYPLADIAWAQEDFIVKKYAGKLVLMPPQPSC